nr:MAG TPA: hypothetical protein [Caudoviricetes sp.]
MQNENSVKPHIYAVRLAVMGKIVYRYQPNRVRNSVIKTNW